ncbi:MAG: hypothetical protein ACLUI3_00990 [Christensenellales bacterium]
MTAKTGERERALANALAGGATTATNDGDVSLRTSGWSRAKDHRSPSPTTASPAR